MTTKTTPTPRDGIYTQQRAEDVFLWHSFMYYVLHHPVIPDAEFDLMHRYFRNLYPESKLLNEFIGSDNAYAYPPHIREHRRPQLYELRAS